MFRRTLFIALLSAAPMLASAQAAWPDRQVRLIVGFPPGTGPDVVARTLGQKLGETLKQTLVIDNRAGAGGQIAAQAVAMHQGAMECFRRAMIPDQPFDTAARLRKDGANLARGMTDMVAALDRKRGKGPQVVRVERVVVHQGGQAIVGTVQAGSAAAANIDTPPPALEQDPPGLTLDGLTSPKLAMVNVDRPREGGGA